MPEEYTDETSEEQPPDPPVRHLKDVPPEEWDYSNRQAFAGCGIVMAVFLGIFLPPTLRFFIDDTTANIVGFGFTAVLASVSIGIIVILTRRKHRERRQADHLSGSGPG